MSFTVGRTSVRIHPLMLLLPLLARRLGAGDALLPLAVGLIVHEGSHLIAARGCHVRVSSLRLMPIGGAIGMDNPYALSPGQLFTVACAGPIGSLCAVILSAALAHWRWIDPFTALAFARINLALMLFNLLPALPLDGGRMLYALLHRRLGRERAVSVGLGLGRVVAAGLLIAACCAALRREQLNLSPIFAAIFLIASGRAEREALLNADVRTLLNAMKPAGRPMAARVYAVDEDCSAQRALRQTRPDAPAIYAVYGENRLKALTDDKSLMEALLSLGESARVSQAWQSPAS